jgi:hypothetical protein
MPTYFFHLTSRGDYVEDEEGIDLPDLEAARCEMIATARDLVLEGLQSGDVNLNDEIEVADDGGQVLMTVKLGKAIGLTGRVLH